MKAKPKKASPTQVAKDAQCSKGLASRLLARGLSPSEIVQRVRERKAREAMRSHAATAGPVNGKVNGHDNSGLMDLPVVPVEIEPGIPPFAVSERRKEFHLASIREHQARKLRGELFPLEPVRSIIFSASQYVRNRLSRLPDELIDELGAERVKILRTHIASIFAEAQRVMTWEAERYGVPLPAPLPPPLRKRLAYYEQFARGSRTGEIENAPLSEQIDSAAWRAAHPSISFEETFKILAAKRRWDQDMLDLMRRRSEWDLPSEIPDTGPPPVPEDDETVM